jgi:multiple sugar transport system ATP-binding protein
VLVYFTVSAAGVGAIAADNPEDAEVRLGGREDGGGPKTRIVARVSPRTRIAEDSEIQLVVDTRRLYFFDPETEAAI